MRINRAIWKRYHFSSLFFAKPGKSSKIERVGKFIFVFPSFVQKQKFCLPRKKCVCILFRKILVITQYNFLKNNCEQTVIKKKIPNLQNVSPKIHRHCDSFDVKFHMLNLWRLGIYVRCFYNGFLIIQTHKKRWCSIIHSSSRIRFVSVINSNFSV